MTEKMIIDAYCRIRTIDQTIPDDVLDFMKDAAIEKLRKHAVSSSVCDNCGEGKPMICAKCYETESNFRESY